VYLAFCRHWLTLRPEKVNCKGKGEMTTYWCTPKAESVDARSSDISGSERSIRGENTCISDDTTQRLINWNVDLLCGLMKDVVKQQGKSMKRVPLALTTFDGQPIDHVKEVLVLPTPHKQQQSAQESDSNKTICESASQQLRELTSAIANLYWPNPFHNFEHACHVSMGTKKMLDRIVEGGVEAADQMTVVNQRASRIVSDPLTQFAIVFAAVIHDLDHPGVSNSQLVQEQHHLAVTYQCKSVAEQNSIDTAWVLLMSPEYADLRACLFATNSDLERFRQVMIHTVMATDLFDKNLQLMRQSRWEQSFQSNSDLPMANANDAECRRATIIVDLIIQASDVSHTMQHFTVYQKWNMRLLTEMYEAYQSGRTTKDPTDGWYEGELWFFDNYIIPLAQKLRECGVFGVSCDEFLDYAKDNRLEWEVRGKGIVEETKLLLQSHAVKQPVLSRFAL
jgi:3'5'-cyclic nucleotide phosphodiesterase